MHEQNRNHGPVVEGGFYHFRSIKDEIVIMKTAAPNTFAKFVRDATSQHTARWMRRGRKALDKGRSINATDKTKSFEGVSLQNELGRLREISEVM